MGLSETILAAMIGAMATVTTAMFQIFSSIKNRNKVDVKPRRGSTMRSMLAVLALMIASAAGGFLYSQLLMERDREDLRAVRSELRELKELTAAARVPALPIAEPVPATVTTPVSLEGVDGRVESVAYVPACRRVANVIDATGACAETDAQRIALCGSIPAYARIDAIDLFAQPDAVQKPWDEHRAVLEQDLGGARFTGKSFEYAQGADLKAVCVNFMQWSSDHPYIARVVVNYGFGERAEPQVTASEPFAVSGAVHTTIAADSVPAVQQQQATFVTSTKP